MAKHRSVASLLTSGVATITLDQHLHVPKTKSTAEALLDDQKSIGRDARRAMRAFADRVVHP